MKHVNINGMLLRMYKIEEDIDMKKNPSNNRRCYKENTIFQLFTISHPTKSAGWGSIVHLDVSAEKKCFR
jgi:hypothetical protein